MRSRNWIWSKVEKPKLFRKDLVLIKIDLLIKLWDEIKSPRTLTGNEAHQEKQQQQKKNLGKAYKQIVKHTEKATTQELENEANSMSYRFEAWRV